MSEHLDRLFRLAHNFYVKPEDHLYQANNYKASQDDFLVLLEVLDEELQQNPVLLRFAGTIGTDARTLTIALRKFLEHYLLIETHDYYQTLGVQSDAEAETIRKHYRHLINIFHPDKNVSSSDQHALLVNQAYNALKKPSGRQDYDKKKTENKIIRQAQQREVTRRSRELSKNAGNKGKIISGLFELFPALRRHPKAWIWSFVLIFAVIIALRPFAKPEIKLSPHYVSEPGLANEPKLVDRADVLAMANDGVDRQDVISTDEKIIDMLKPQLSIPPDKDTELTREESTIKKSAAVTASVMKASARKINSNNNPFKAKNVAFENQSAAQLAENNINMKQPQVSAHAQRKNIAKDSSAKVKSPHKTFAKPPLNNRTFGVDSRPITSAEKKRAVIGESLIKLPDEVFPSMGVEGLLGQASASFLDEKLTNQIIAIEKRDDQAVFNSGIPEMVLMQYVSAYESGNAKAIAKMFTSANQHGKTQNLEKNYNKLFSSTTERKLKVNELVIRPESNSKALLLSNVVISLKDDKSYKQYSGKLLFRVVGGNGGMLISGLTHNVR